MISSGATLLTERLIAGHPLGRTECTTLDAPRVDRQHTDGRPDRRQCALPPITLRDGQIGGACQVDARIADYSLLAGRCWPVAEARRLSIRRRLAAVARKYVRLQAQGWPVSMRLIL